MFFQLWGGFTNSKNQQYHTKSIILKKNQNIIPPKFEKILNFSNKNITIQKFLKINVPRFLEIHGP